MSWRIGLIEDPHLREAWKLCFSGKVSEAKSRCRTLPPGPGRIFLGLRIAIIERDVSQFEGWLAAPELDAVEYAVACAWKLDFLRALGKDDQALKSELDPKVHDTSVDIEARREIALRLFNCCSSGEGLSRADLIALLLEDGDLHRKALFEQHYKVQPLARVCRYEDAISAARRALVLVDLSEEQSVGLRTVLLENITAFAISCGNGNEALSACRELHATVVDRRAPELLNPAVYLNAAIRMGILGYFDQAYELCLSVQGMFFDAPLDPVRVARCWIAVCAGDATIGRVEINEALQLAQGLDANVHPLAVQQLHYLIDLCIEVDIDRAEALLDYVNSIRKSFAECWPIASAEVAANLQLSAATICLRRGNHREALVLANDAFGELVQRSAWGAVRCALLLCQLTGESTWLTRAKQLAQGYGPKFFLLPQIRAIEDAAVGSPLAQLTPRQRTIATALAGGKAPGEIAREIGISTNTVRVHMQAVYRAFCVKTRAQLVLALSSINL